MAYVTPKIEIDTQEAIALWFEGKSTAEIGRKMGVSREIARRRLNEAGINTSMKPNLKPKDQPPTHKGTLTPMEVLAVIAFHVHEYKIREVGDWLGVEPRVAQNFIYRGSDKLRRRGIPE